MEEFYEQEPETVEELVLSSAGKRPHPRIAFGVWLSVLLASAVVYYLYSVSGYFRGFGQFPYYFTISAGASVAIWIGMYVRHNLASLLIPVLAFVLVGPLQVIGLLLVGDPRFWEIFSTQTFYTEFRFGIICVELYLASRWMGIYLVAHKQEPPTRKLGLRTFFIATLAIAAVASIFQFSGEEALAKEYGAKAGMKEYLGWVAAFALASGTTMIMMIPFWMGLRVIGAFSLLLSFLVPALVFYLFEVWRVSTGERSSGFDELFPFVVGDFLGAFCGFALLYLCGYRLKRANHQA